MKAKVTYIGSKAKSIIENPKISFADFCFGLFESKVYISLTTNKTPAMAINPNNIIFVEEILG